MADPDFEKKQFQFFWIHFEAKIYYSINEKIRKILRFLFYQMLLHIKIYANFYIQYEIILCCNKILLTNH